LWVMWEGKNRIECSFCALDATDLEPGTFCIGVLCLALAPQSLWFRAHMKLQTTIRFIIIWCSNAGCPLLM
jgi:hypothetical protein